jgi:3-hydroxyisobutyrate dehydrogenase-like beta-hydroxyacid dehydrogenase
MRVGFIGLGRMGAPMASRVAAAGHRVAGYDVVPAKRQIGITGVTFVDSPAAVGAEADVVVSSLPGPTEVDDVVYGGSGLLASVRPGTIVVETSTISPKQSRKIAADLAARKVHSLDAPISGGARGAQDGTLVAMVGGSPDTLARAHPVLTCFAKDIFHLGPAGAGSTMKIVIQSIFLSQMAGFLEAISLGERCGIEVDTMLKIVAASSAHHPAIGTRYDKLNSGNLDPMFEIGSAVKDMSLAENIWHELGLPLPTLASALFDYRAAAAEGFDRTDLIAVRNWLNRFGVQ